MENGEKITILFKDGSSVEATITNTKHIGEDFLQINCQFNQWQIQQNDPFGPWTCSGCSNDPCCCEEKYAGSDDEGVMFLCRACLGHNGNHICGFEEEIGGCFP